MRTFRRKPADRAGYTLALFAMFFFGMMGLAALVIDIAFVRFAQRNMQAAVDSAALEGLRWRDSIPSQWYTPGNPTYDAIVAVCGAPFRQSPTSRAIRNGKLGPTKRVAGRPAIWSPTCSTTISTRRTATPTIMGPGRKCNS